MFNIAVSTIIGDGSWYEGMKPEYICQVIRRNTQKIDEIINFELLKIKLILNYFLGILFNLL